MLYNPASAKQQGKNLLTEFMGKKKKKTEILKTLFNSYIVPIIIVAEKCFFRKKKKCHTFFYCFKGCKSITVFWTTVKEN